MAYPFVLFENIFEDGTITADSEQSGYPDDNIIDWRQGTPFRWKSDSLTDDQVIKLDLGVGETASPDTIAIGGHNIDDVSVGAGAPAVRVYYSDNDIAYNLYVAMSITSNYPHVATFTASAHRYFQIEISKEAVGDLVVKPEAGIITLGRRLDFTEGVMADLDPYGYNMAVDRSTNDYGSPIGVNVRHEAKTFNLSYDEPGFLVSDFFDPVSGLGYDDDFAPHVKAGKPFWFAWNTDTQADGVWLCHTDAASHPFLGSTLRRGWNGTFHGYREVAEWQPPVTSLPPMASASRYSGWSRLTLTAATKTSALATAPRLAQTVRGVITVTRHAKTRRTTMRRRRPGASA
jgi:hypothetical protein